ncbi:DUF305 domain-containing protein [Pseudonocardia acaciae]|uniref:DUF305 domain-containing protein n=1 Tax=Pseudonocardia acaciae TaxID=551276 RepID=UPI0004907D3A|nr:DUF305 domain-containing protein [Pseudonocardia acaciae]
MSLDAAAHPDSTGTEHQPAWPRYVLVAGGALALLLLGAAVGLLLALPGSSSTPTAPGPHSVDVGFAQDMTVHHEQAVQMATWERDHTTDPELRQLAYDMESGQSRQIGHMQGWLGLWGASSLPTGPFMRWMPADMPGHGSSAGHTGVTHMPGMATDAELRQLRATTGKPLDVYFLQLMLRHHEGGTAMLSYAAHAASQPDVRNLAAQMLTAQTTESQYMRHLLAARGATPLPPG